MRFESRVKIRLNFATQEYFSCGKNTAHVAYTLSVYKIL